MNRRTVAFGLVLAVCAAGLCSAAPDWAKSFDAAVKISKEQNKPIMVFFTAGSG